MPPKIDRRSTPGKVTSRGIAWKEQGGRKESAKPVLPESIQNSSVYKSYLQRIKGQIIDDYYNGTTLQDVNFSETWFCYSADGVLYGVTDSPDEFIQNFSEEELMLFTLDSKKGRHVIPPSTNGEEKPFLSGKEVLEPLR